MQERLARYRLQPFAMEPFPALPTPLSSTIRARLSKMHLPPMREAAATFFSIPGYETPSLPHEYEEDGIREAYH
jgi:hypothetical protein